MMRELVGSGKVEQLSHHSLYLKNMLGPHLGLDHPLSFDPYTGVLSQALVDRRPEDVLGIVCNHAMAGLATGFQEAVKRKFQELRDAGKEEEFRTLYNSLEHLRTSLTQEGEASSPWELNETTYQVVGPTPQGALEILAGAGILGLVKK